MSDTPRTDRHFDAWGVESKYDLAARAFAGRLEKELATAKRIAVSIAEERDAAIKKLSEEARLRGTAEAKIDELESVISFTGHVRCEKCGSVHWKDGPCTPNPGHHAPAASAGSVDGVVGISNKAKG